MNIIFEPMQTAHQKDIMAIFNHYITTGTAAFAGSALPEPFFGMLLKKSEGYPAYALRDEESGCVVGFCQLSAYNPFSSFKATACLSYFMAEDCTGHGLGTLCLEKLTDEATKMGISNLIAEVSTENEGSLRFHENHGFSKVGELRNIGSKFGRSFGVVYMQKNI